MIGRWTREWLEHRSMPFHFFDSTTSTNSVAKQNSMVEKMPIVFYVTNSQTEGRGQGTHRWINSKPGTNLLMTISLSCTTSPQPEWCLSIAELLIGACRQIWPQLPWSLKPLNDIYLDQSKVAGLLLESVSQGDQYRLLLGLGLNVFDHPKDPGFAATDLVSNLNREVNRAEWFQFLNLFFDSILTTAQFQ